MRKLLVLACGALFLTGCACFLPERSCHQGQALERKLQLLEADFAAHSPFTGPSGHVYPIYRPAGRLANCEGPPVLLMHEMPALSAETLELAKRLASNGYRVYVPILFGNVRDNPQDQIAALRHILERQHEPLWLASEGDVQRPIVKDIAAISRMIASENPGRRLGVIGLCFTGIIPLALLGQTPKVPALAALVLSQPSLPFPSCDRQSTHALGISPEELGLARQRIVDENLEVLGFRFEEDQVSPRERFARLNRELNEQTGALHFRDETLLAARYHDVDKLPLRSHPVLTEGFRRWLPGGPEPATHYAYRQLIAFLDAKLKDYQPRPFQSPPLLKAPTLGMALEFGGCGEAADKPHPATFP